MCCKIFDEMDKCIDYQVYSGRKAEKRFKCHKPYYAGMIISRPYYMCIPTNVSISHGITVCETIFRHQIVSSKVVSYHRYYLEFVLMKCFCVFANPVMVV